MSDAVGEPTGMRFRLRTLMFVPILLALGIVVLDHLIGDGFAADRDMSHPSDLS
jgi:hypothetical protein